MSVPCLDIVSKIVSYEDLYWHAQQCQNDAELHDLFINIVECDKNSYKDLGLELYFDFVNDRISSGIEKFDQKILKIAFIISHYDGEMALKFLKHHVSTAEKHSKSFIRYSRISNAVEKSHSGILRKKDNGLEITQITPKVDSSFPLLEINLNDQVKFQPIINGVINTKVSIAREDFGKQVRDADIAIDFLDDDMDEFQASCIANISTSHTGTYNLYVLQDVRFSHEPSGIVFQSNQRLRYLYSANGIFHHFRVCGKTVLANANIVLPLAYVIPRKGTKNYYHSLVDIIPNFYGYKKLDLDCPLVISHDLSPVEEYFIDRLGINRNCIVDTRVDPVLIEKAIVPHASTFRQSFYAYCKKVAKKQVSLWGNTETGAVVVQKSRAVYISRSRSPNRPLVNEVEVEQLAESMGFRIVHMEDIGLEDQIAIAHQADLVVGPHGAGLTNMVFSKSNCRVLELIPRKYLTPLFCQLASDCDIGYGVLIGDMVEDSISSQADFRWSIDLEKLQMTISRLLSHANSTALEQG